MDLILALLMILFLAVCWYSFFKVMIKMGNTFKQSIIPIYNNYKMLERVFGNTTYAIIAVALVSCGGLFPEFVCAIIYIVVGLVWGIRLAYAFGKDKAFGVCLVILQPIFLLILAKDKTAMYRDLEPLDLKHPFEPKYLDAYEPVVNVDDSSEVTYCIHCGNKLFADDVFCNQCGNKR